MKCEICGALIGDSIMSVNIHAQWHKEGKHCEDNRCSEETG